MKWSLHTRPISWDHLRGMSPHPTRHHLQTGDVTLPLTPSPPSEMTPVYNGTPALRDVTKTQNHLHKDNDAHPNAVISRDEGAQLKVSSPETTEPFSRYYLQRWRLVFHGIISRIAEPLVRNEYAHYEVSSPEMTAYNTRSHFYPKISSLTLGGYYFSRDDTLFSKPSSLEMIPYNICSHMFVFSFIHPRLGCNWKRDKLWARPANPIDLLYYRNRKISKLIQTD